MKYITAILFIILFLMGVYYSLSGEYVRAIVYLIIQSIVYLIMRMDEIQSDIRDMMKLNEFKEKVNDLMKKYDNEQH